MIYTKIKLNLNYQDRKINGSLNLREKLKTNFKTKNCLISTENRIIWPYILFRHIPSLLLSPLLIPFDKFIQNLEWQLLIALNLTFSETCSDMFPYSIFPHFHKLHINLHMVLWKYAANLQENIHAEVWFQ